MAVEIGWPMAQERFRAMGSECHIVAVGPGRDHLQNVVNRCVERVNALERRWSRFLLTSEISALNQNNGQPLLVSPETINLIERAVLAWQLTGGRFDPTMELRMAELGYDRAFDHIEIGPAPLPGPEPGRGCDAVIVDRSAGTVQLPPMVGFDPGGIGKGYAADITATEVMFPHADGAGCWGIMVNLGGDLRVIGTPPSGEAWAVAIAEPTVADGTLSTVRLNDAGLATSTNAKRRWKAADGDRNHLLDPATGLPSAGGTRLASVIAGEAWWAEAAATALAAGQQPPGQIPDNCSALMVDEDETISRLGGFEHYETEGTR